jgi:hypothetical protein
MRNKLGLSLRTLFREEKNKWNEERKDLKEGGEENARIQIDSIIFSLIYNLVKFPLSL